MVADALFSSKTDDWETPKSLFDKLDATFHFDIDVCASKENAKCAKYFTREQDGLKQDWGGGCYLVQSALRARDRPMGKALRRAFAWHSSNAHSGANRYEMVA